MPFPSSPGPLYQNELSTSPLIWKLFFILMRIKRMHFHKKGCAPGLILKVRFFGTRKRPIEDRFVMVMARFTFSQFYYLY